MGQEPWFLLPKRDEGKMGREAKKAHIQMT